MANRTLRCAHCRQPLGAITASDDGDVLTCAARIVHVERAHHDVLISCECGTRQRWVGAELRWRLPLPWQRRMNDLVEQASETGGVRR